MVPAFLASPALKLFVLLTLIASASAIGYVKGRQAATQRCELERLRLDTEIRDTREYAAEQAHQQERELHEARYQIEVMHDQHEDEIADALERNRELVHRLQRNKAHRDRGPVSDHPAATASPWQDAPAVGPLPGAIPPIPPEFAAECDRVLATAIAGQQWAKSIESTIRESHVGH